jgi:AraC-like DNA-binding protein
MRTKSTGIIRFFNPSDLPHVKAVHGENVSHEFPRHIHNGLSIGIIMKGERVVEGKGQSHAIPKNSVFIINPGEPHTCKSFGREHSYFVISIDAGTVNAFASRISGKAKGLPRFKDTVLHHSELNLIIQQFFGLVKVSGSTLEKESMVVSLLSTLILHHGEKPPRVCRNDSHTNTINNACEFIKANYSCNISLKHLSKAAGLSSFYFQRLFVKHLGVSPYDYLVQIRIKKAMELFNEGQSIVNAALNTGFADQSHFSRVFKRVTGITPGLFARRENDHFERKKSNLTR